MKKFVQNSVHDGEKKKIKKKKKDRVRPVVEKREREREGRIDRWREEGGIGTRQCFRVGANIRIAQPRQGIRISKREREREKGVGGRLDFRKLIHKNVVG